MKINKKLLSTILVGVVSFSIVWCVSDSNNSKQNSNSKTIVAIHLEIENTSDKSVDIYPTQGTLAINTKKQIEYRMIFPGSEDLTGEYLGNTLKKGVVAFVVDSDLKDINSIQYKFEACEEQGDRDENINFYEFLFNINLNK